MRFGFIENEMLLTSSGACNLMMEWIKLLRTKHQVDLIHWSKKNVTKVAVQKAKEYHEVIRCAYEDETVLEDYDIIVTNYISDIDMGFKIALSKSKKPATIFVYHDRSVARDIFTNPDIRVLIESCDYVMTYQPKLLIEKLGVNPEVVQPMDMCTFYKDPREYLDTNQVLMRDRFINMLYCNRTNNFKGARYFMEWCKFLNEHPVVEHKGGLRIMKGFHPDYPHNDLPNYKTEPYRDKMFSSDLADFYTENYGDHDRCLHLLKQSKFVWLAQDYSKYPTEYFKDQKDYMSYLNYDLDGTSLEAIFCGCIPILHIAQLNNSTFVAEPIIRENCLFFDPDKGYEDLYEQYKAIDVNKAQRNLREVTELYKNNHVFLNGLELSIMPKRAFDFYKGMIQGIS